MKLNEIGKTGIKIPPIIFGTSALGNLYTALSDETKLEIVQQAFEHVPAPVVFDSAGKYGAGLALEKLGECLEKLNIAPENVIISNKLGWKRTPLLTPEPTFEQGVWMDLKNDAVQDISYEGILNCYEQGNELLGGKYFPQLASVHDPDEYLNAATSSKDRDSRFANIVEAYKALADLKKSGKVKAIGVGAKNWKIIEEVSKEVELDYYAPPERFTRFYAIASQQKHKHCKLSRFSCRFFDWRSVFRLSTYTARYRRKQSNFQMARKFLYFVRETQHFAGSSLCKFCNYSTGCCKHCFEYIKTFAHQEQCGVCGD